MFYSAWHIQICAYSNMATPKPPAQDATPEAVRTYFTTILKELHNVSEADAVSIASHWEYGRGSEIPYYDIDTYRSLFGPEVGILLYGHARQELRSGKRGPSQGTGKVPRKPEVDIFGQEPSGESLKHVKSGTSVIANINFCEAGLLKIILLLTIGLGVSAMGATNTDQAAGMGAIACVSGFLFVVGYVVFYFG
jgi:hypothetical protein